MKELAHSIQYFNGEKLDAGKVARLKDTTLASLSELGEELAEERETRAIIEARPRPTRKIPLLNDEYSPFMK